MIVATALETDTIIVVPTLGERIPYIRELLESLESQTFPIFVEIVAPHFSHDLIAVLDNYPKIHRTTCKGNIATVVNYVLTQRSDFKYANWIGDDDRLPPASVELSRNVISKTPGCVLSFGRCRYIDSAGTVLFQSSIDRFAARINFFVPASIKLEGGLFSLEAFHAVGGLDTSLRFTPDVDLVLKLQRLGSVCPVLHCVSEFRLHYGSDTTSRRAEQLKEAQSVQRRYLSGLPLVAHRVLALPIRLALWLFFRFTSREDRNRTRNQ